MKLNEIHCCLDCDYAGRLHHTQHGSQCPACASRAVWPVASWTKPTFMKLPWHQVRSGIIPLTCCDMAPTFFGGGYGYQQR